MTETSIIFTPLQDIHGTGKIHLEDNAEVEIDFHLQILRNGKGVGTIFFKTVPPNIDRFSINGYVSETKDEVTVENCRLTSFTDTEVKFSFRSLKIFRKSLKWKPQEKIYLHASILNMYQTRKVTVETKIGQLSVGVYDGIEKNESVMRLYEIPLVTSFLQIDINPNGSETVENISSKGKNLIEKFLKITSLYQMVWQDWVTVGIYETDTDSFLFFEFTSPKLQIPISSPLGNRCEANEFINAAWEGYTDDLELKHNFNSALEWFIDSNGSTLYETRYLDATTCLEMLMDKFHSNNSSEFLLADPTFDELYNVTRATASNFLKSKEIDPKTRQSVYSAFKGCNRRSYLEKLRMLIEHWNISIEDLQIKLDEIKDIRNKITHEGRYPITSPKDFEYAEKVYFGLMTILVRLFLAMLNYKNGYFDPWQNRLISN